jgi:hypothetical protein
LVLVRHRADISCATAAKPGRSLFLWGLGGCKSPARRRPFALAPSVRPFAGAKTFRSLARAARWLPVREEPSPQRDTDGDHQKKLMKTKNYMEEPAPANAVQPSSNAVRNFMVEKAWAVATLAEYRRWRSLVEQGANSDVLAGFKCGALVAFQHIERETPEWELWTSLPDEAELTSQSRTGDHLAVTRRLLGFLG